MKSWADTFDPSLAEALWRSRARLVSGTPADDVLRGTPGDDTFDVSQGGEDVVTAGKGDDTIYFGAAFSAGDRVVDRAGSDTIVFDGDYRVGMILDRDHAFNVETIRFVAGHSYTVGGALDLRDGNDGSVFDGKSLGAEDVLRLDASGSRVDGLLAYGGAGNDVLTGSRGQYSSLAGGAGDDVLTGVGVNGTLTGGDGDDVLIGGRQQYLLFGGAGADSITVGGNETQIVYQAASDSGRRGPDLIIGFRPGAVIGLYGVDADTISDGDQAFHFGATPEHVGDLIVRYNAALDLTIVRGFTDGDDRPDMVIHLAGDVPLTPSDVSL